ncbi:hypothetical protein HZH66_001805 [Vespula vulgaris]|uniref:Uncharacterized protein n=1 Tax=Vespula vulgaris TaxID=7454 RepID=A0A834NH62_VESVU|nr:hypothetical protein HZH66_001805 [Vespula vulgaris]
MTWFGIIKFGIVLTIIVSQMSFGIIQMPSFKIDGNGDANGDANGDGNGDGNGGSGGGGCSNNDCRRRTPSSVSRSCNNGKKGVASPVDASPPPLPMTTEPIAR